MRRGLPVRGRLAVWYTAVLSLGLILFSVTIWLVLRHALYADLSATLANQGRGFEEYLHLEEKDEAADMVREMDEYSRSLPPGHLLTVRDAAGGLIYDGNPQGNEAPADSHLTRGANSEANAVLTIYWRGGRYLALDRAVQLKLGRVRVFLGMPTDSLDRTASLLGWLLSLAVPVFVLCAGAGGYWLSRKALQPVDRITERARLIGVGNLAERLPVPNTRDELQRMTETWNSMLERLGAAVSRISRFTADASHELRTPVAIIRLAAENALRKTRSEVEYRSALERIQRESVNMTSLIEDLLFLARADVEQSAGGSEPVELGELVKSVCADLSPLASAKDLTLEQCLPDAPVTVLGRFPDLRRMLLILLDNAIKYTPAGGLVTVRLDQDRRQAVLRVEDSGIGIPEEAKTRLFQRFFRADASRSKESGGYGLGLAIAQAIVQQHKASIQLLSKAGGGCVFSVSLPVAA